MCVALRTRILCGLAPALHATRRSGRKVAGLALIAAVDEAAHLHRLTMALHDSLAARVPVKRTHAKRISSPGLSQLLGASSNCSSATSASPPFRRSPCGAGGVRTSNHVVDDPRRGHSRRTLRPVVASRAFDNN